MSLKSWILFTVLLMHDVMIIGAGPAGLSAALQLKRYGVDLVLLEGQRVGGLLNNANLVENYPGFPGGIPGKDLINLFLEQITQLGVEFTMDEVQSLDYQNGSFKAVGQRSVYEANITIVATGTRGKIPEGIIIPEGFHDRIASEIFPIRNVENKRIAIIGAGDLAFDYALNLGRWNNVIILNRSEVVSCLPLLWDRAISITSIQYQNLTRLEEIKPGAGGEILLAVNSPKGQTVISCDFLIFAVGRIPNAVYCSETLKGSMHDLEQKGKLYFIGDVKNGMYRQAAIAVGDGIKCAMMTYNTLKEK